MIEPLALEAVEGWLTWENPETVDLPLWANVALILVLSIVVAKLLESIGYWLIGVADRHDEATFSQAVLEEVNYPLYLTVFLGGVYASVELLAHADVQVFGEPIDPLTGIIADVLLSAIVILWIYAAVKIGDRFVGVLMAGEGTYEFAPIANTVFKVVVLFAGFFSLLGVWGVDVTPFIASAGILGIIIGIAAQDTIGNLFAGVTLSFDKTYKVGDVLTLSTGERGTVTKISFRSTTLRTRDDVEVTVPNSEIANSRITNESAPHRHRRIRLEVGVAYGSDLERVREVLYDVAEAEPLVLEEPSPSVEARHFDDSAIVHELKVYISHPVLRGRVMDRLIRRVHVAFHEEGISIPFPQRTVSYLEGDGEGELRQPSLDVPSDLPADVEFDGRDGAVDRDGAEGTSGVDGS